MNASTHKPRLRALGMMSGTSMDGVDAALIETDGERIFRFGPTAARPYSRAEREVIGEALAAARALGDRQSRPGRLAEAEGVVTRAHAEAAEALLADSGLSAGDVDVVGFHGQTVLHRPERGLTVQIGDGPGLAARLGIDVVCDFREADMAAGGQGAPFAPAFHRALALHAGLEMPVAVVNIGGVANVTWLSGENDPVAFDTGPGNALLDDLVRARTGAVYDAEGALARAGHVNAAALEALLAHPYFDLAPPKSLDRDDFDAGTLARLSPADAAATLVAFTAESIGRAACHLPCRPRRWIVTGGGAHNPAIMDALAELMAEPVEPAQAVGWSPDFIEAQAFAYLAVRSLRGLPLSFPGTTGVVRPLSGGRLERAGPRAAA